MNIQIFGTKKCNDTKKAERFFKERGIKYQFIDMKEKEEEGRLLSYMQTMLNRDSKKAVAVDMTKLGLMEITRKKIRRPLEKEDFL